MTKQINLFAIRIKGTDLYKSSAHSTFGPYEDAMMSGVYYNQAKNAERHIKETMARLTAGKGYTRMQSYYSICDETGKCIENCTFFQEVADATWTIKVREIELEVVTLTLSVTL
jgi:hypothetical protein